MFCVPAVRFPLVTQGPRTWVGSVICDCHFPCFWCLPLGGQGWARGLFQASWWEALVHAHSWVELGLGPLVDRDTSKGGVGLCSHPVGCLACESQHRSLQAVEWGQVSQPRWKKCLLPTGVNIGPSCVCHQLIWPWRATALPTCLGDPWRAAGRSDPVFCGVATFVPCWTLCAPSWSEMSFFLSPSCDPALLAFKAKCCGVSS